MTRLETLAAIRPHLPPLIELLSSFEHPSCLARIEGGSGIIRSMPGVPNNPGTDGKSSVIVSLSEGAEVRIDAFVSGVEPRFPNWYHIVSPTGWVWADRVKVLDPECPLETITRSVTTISHLGITVVGNTPLSLEDQQALEELVESYNLSEDEMEILLSGVWVKSDLLRAIEVLQELKSYGINIGVSRELDRVPDHIPGSWRLDQLEALLAFVEVASERISKMTREVRLYDRYSGIGLGFHAQEYAEYINYLAEQYGVSPKAVPFIHLFGGSLTFRIDAKDYSYPPEHWFATSSGGGVVTFGQYAFFEGTKGTEASSLDFTSPQLVTHEAVHQIFYILGNDVMEGIFERYDTEMSDRGLGLDADYTIGARSSDLHSEIMTDAVTNWLWEAFTTDANGNLDANGDFRKTQMDSLMKEIIDRVWGAP
jgi:hypothetical protein